jgi:hypothetical protein
MNRVACYIQRAVLCFASVLIASAGSPSSAADKSSELPVVYKTDFEQAEEWKPMDAKSWKVIDIEGGKAFSLTTGSKYSPPHRSPVNIAILRDVVVGDFELQAKVQSTGRDYGHRDLVFVFGYQDPSHFYYTHLARNADDHANQIFIVNDKPRTKISITTTEGTPWDDNWHNIKIVRRVEAGTIEVYFDDMQKPVMTAKDKTFAWGQIGIGSFDDSGNFDSLELRGKKVEPKKTASAE